MEPDRREHRSPFIADGSTLRTGNALPVGTMVTPQLAKFAAVSMSFFDDLTRAARVCLGEYEQLSNPEAYPGYIALKKLVDDYEKALRNT